MSSSSYSSLLKRTKLATFDPSIDRVLTAPPSSLSRSSYGFKRPVPSTSTSKAPFIRLNSLDTPQRRTDYRQATQEAMFVRKWEHARQQMEPIKMDSSAAVGPIPVPVRSHYVPEEYTQADLPKGKRAPNIFAMSDHEFSKFLETLDRADFVKYLASHGHSDVTKDPWASARQSTTALLSLIESYLSARHPSTSDVPHFHPYASIVYSPPTQLEASVEPPIPGRLLGSKLALVMSFLDERQDSQQVASTTWFPDRNGERLNSAGRAYFTLSPVLSPNIASDDTQSWQPQALSTLNLRLSPRVVGPANVGRAEVGSQAWAGQEDRNKSKGSTDVFSLVNTILKRPAWSQSPSRQESKANLASREELKQRRESDALKAAQRRKPAGRRDAIRTLLNNLREEEEGGRTGSK